MRGTLKPGGRALIVSSYDPVNTGREVITVSNGTCRCGKSSWFVSPVSGTLTVTFFDAVLPVRGREYHADELMPLDGDPDEVGDVDVKKPEDVTA